MIDYLGARPGTEPADGRRRHDVTAAHLAGLIDIAADAIISIDHEHRILLFNRGAEEIFGYRADEVLGETLDCLVPDRFKAAHAGHVQRFGRSPSSARLMGERGEIFGRRKNGEEFPAEASISKQSDEGPVTFTVILRDATKRKRAEAALRASEDRLRLLAENSGDFVLFRYRLEPDERLEYVSAGCNAVTGYTPEELMGDDRLAMSLVAPNSRLALQLLRTGPELSGEPLTMRMRRKDGAEIWLQHRYLAVPDDDGRVTTIDGIAYDITARKMSEERLSHLALHDSLTGLANRALFVDRLGVALASIERTHRSVAVCFLDLDHFKLVNDSYGHAAGDEVLIEVGRRLKAATRAWDTPARLGGDEFAILFDDVADPSAVLRSADRIACEIGRPFRVAGREHVVTASVGIAFAELASADPHELLRDADAAAYLAKEQGRNRYEVFDATMRERAVRRLELQNGLRGALDRGEMYLAYQPIVDLRDGTVVGSEALLRWHPQADTTILPTEFIGIAEETGVIESIGGWALEEACRARREWERTVAGSTVPTIAVNLSPRQLLQPGLAPAIATVLDDTETDPRLLCLEITENALLLGTPEVLAVLNSLKRLGVTIALDDFGTGYSSLSYLADFPVDTIKLDKSFIDRLHGDRADWSLVDAVLKMARSLNLEVIAEGVETAEQFTLLCDLGCPVAQGFFFSRPLSRDAFAERMTTNLLGAI